MDIEHEQNIIQHLTVSKIICGTLDIIVSSLSNRSALPSYASDWKRCDGLNMNPPIYVCFFPSLHSLVVLGIHLLEIRWTQMIDKDTDSTTELFEPFGAHLLHLHLIYIKKKKKKKKFCLMHF